MIRKTNIVSRVFCMLMITCMLITGMTQEIKAAEQVGIVLTYEGASYTTMVYGPEIANINSGTAIATSTWIQEICNHVYTSSFQTVRINVAMVQKDVFAKVNAGESLVTLDLKNYIQGSETTAAGIDTKISECTTKYVVGQDRSKNIIVAASRLNGLILQPGTGISVDTMILPRTTENGYGMGNAIMGDEFIKVVGGGICQVSSTLNTAVLRAGIIPTEHHNHSQNVSYLASGLDATISSGKLDYQFVNTLSYPIYVEAVTDNGILKIALYSNSKALNGITYRTEVEGTKKKNTTYIIASFNGIDIGKYRAYSSSYK